jgi:NADH-quinone oxidoreductase subunit M
VNAWFHPLVLITFLPLLGLALLLLVDGRNQRLLRWVALLTSLATLGLAVWAFLLDRQGNLTELSLSWLRLGRLPVRFHLGADGISLLMVLLTTFLMPLALLSSWSAVTGERLKGFLALFLLLEVGMNGVFLALDLVLFYVFWEFTLVPMIFLIAIWGGERRTYAALKFFLYTMVGSVLLLIGILFVGLQVNSFDLPALIQNRATFAGAQTALFVAFGLAFAIKVPLWPLHSWLPDAHVEAPTAGSVILAGVLLKMGAYGFLRFNLPLFPQASQQLAPWMAGLAVVGILYGAGVAFAQKDWKKLVAYSSVSHLGFVMLGIFALTPQAVSGAVLQMVNHGLSTGALFLLVGMLYERRHTRELAAFGGLWKVLPLLSALGLIVTLSSLAVPGLNGFVGEFNILAGAFDAPALGSIWFAGLGTVGVILAAAYLLKMFEKVFLGPLTHEENRNLADLNIREVLTLLPIVVLVVAIGVYPQPIFDLISPAVERLLMLAAQP